MEAPTADGAERRRSVLDNEKITSSSPRVAMTSERKWAPEARCLVEIETAASLYMTLASTAPPTQPDTWAGR